jgi:SWI/SNF-related matrix-associated actin-dependent regulator 1 of chromatin subfamily A
VIKTATIEEDKLAIRFDYRPELVQEIKTRIPGRRWDSANKRWTAPLSPQALRVLKANEFTLSDELEAWGQSRRLEKQSCRLNLPEGLYPFQTQGVGFIEQTNGRTLIADEMGLGKTVQALAWLYAHPEIRPVVIVPPATVKVSWERMTQTWLGVRPWVMYGSQTEGQVEETIRHPIIIVNYDLLHTAVKYKDSLSLSLAEYLNHYLKPKVVIVDECHYLSNRQAKRTKATSRLVKGVPHIIALSGTPITSRPVQFYNTLHLIRPDLFSSFWHYAQRYCGARKNPFGWDFSGASHTAELNEMLTNSMMIRRRKQDVLTDLPDKVRTGIVLDIDNRASYERAAEDFVTWLHKQGLKEKAEKAKQAEALATVEGLKQLAAKGKLESALEWIKDFLEDGDQKLIVFTNHIQFRDAVWERFQRQAVRATGGGSTQRAADAFQNDPNVRLFVGNIDAAGVGITLTAASNVAFLELPWTPGKLQQAEDRAHRIGQKDCVNVYYLLAKDTIDEEIAALLDSKAKTLSQVLDGKDVESGSLLTDLMERCRHDHDKAGVPCVL